MTIVAVKTNQKVYGRTLVKQTKRIRGQSYGRKNVSIGVEDEEIVNKNSKRRLFIEEQSDPDSSHEDDYNGEGERLFNILNSKNEQDKDGRVGVKVRKGSSQVPKNGKDESGSIAIKENKNKLMKEKLKIME